MSQGGCNPYQRNVQSDIQGDIQGDLQGEEDELGRLDQIRRHLPGLPFGAHVSAIPARDTGVPPGSVEGASRVAQIMRFGFPRIGQYQVSH